MTEKEKAEEMTCKKFCIPKNVLLNILDGLIMKTYHERDIFHYYHGIIVGLAEGRKENEQLKAALEKEKKINAYIKARFVECNTCTPDKKDKCLMFSENLCEGERCSELVDLDKLINDRINSEQ